MPKKGLFIHIHKCAGMSVRSVIRTMPDVQWCAGKRLVRVRKPKEQNEFETLDMPAELWEQSFKFAFVRNPWARLVSTRAMFNARKRKRKFWKLEDIVRIAEDDSMRVIPMVLRKKTDWNDALSVKIHALPAHHPYYHLNELDFVGRFENLRQDWEHVCTQLELPVTVPLPHRNRSRHPHYATQYTPQLRDRVAKVFAEDIERFGYVFGENG